MGLSWGLDVVNGFKGNVKENLACLGSRASSEIKTLSVLLRTAPLSKSGLSHKIAFFLQLLEFPDFL